jgi:hypothetical protein
VNYFNSFNVVLVAAIAFSAPSQATDLFCLTRTENGVKTKVQTVQKFELTDADILSPKKYYEIDDESSLATSVDDIKLGDKIFLQFNSANQPILGHSGRRNGVQKIYLKDAPLTLDKSKLWAKATDGASNEYYVYKTQNGKCVIDASGKAQDCRSIHVEYYAYQKMSEHRPDDPKTIVTFAQGACPLSHQTDDGDGHEPP